MPISQHGPVAPTLTPTAGRDFKSKKAVLEHWNANKDFILNQLGSRWDGKPCNKSAMQDIHEVWFRYDRLRKVFSIKQ